MKVEASAHAMNLQNTPLTLNFDLYELPPEYGYL